MKIQKPSIMFAFGSGSTTPCSLSNSSQSWSVLAERQQRQVMYEDVQKSSRTKKLLSRHKTLDLACKQEQNQLDWEWRTLSGHLDKQRKIFRNQAERLCERLTKSRSRRASYSHTFDLLGFGGNVQETENELKKANDSKRSVHIRKARQVTRGLHPRRPSKSAPASQRKPRQFKRDSISLSLFRNESESPRMDDCQMKLYEKNKKHQTALSMEVIDFMYQIEKYKKAFNADKLSWLSAEQVDEESIHGHFRRKFLPKTYPGPGKTERFQLTHPERTTVINPQHLNKYGIDKNNNRCYVVSPDSDSETNEENVHLQSTRSPSVFSKYGKISERTQSNPESKREVTFKENSASKSNIPRERLSFADAVKEIMKVLDVVKVLQTSVENKEEEKQESVKNVSVKCKTLYSVDKNALFEAWEEFLDDMTLDGLHNLVALASREKARVKNQRFKRASLFKGFQSQSNGTIK